MRDMTKTAYAAALKRHGFQWYSPWMEFFGYVKISEKLSVHPSNAGPRLRDRLAYLIRCAEKAEEKERP